MQVLEQGAGTVVPCDDCGIPVNQGNGTGAFGYALEYRCDMVSDLAISVIVVKMGVNKKTTEPVTFKVFADGAQQGGDFQLDSNESTVPEQFGTMMVNHTSGVSQRIQVIATGNVSGKTYVNYDKVITCNCPTIASTTTTSSTTTIPVTSPSTSVPGSSTSSSPTSPTTTTPGSFTSTSVGSSVTLPATGGNNGAGMSFDASIGILLAGTLLIGASRLRRKNRITR
jgi:hypothetical protein